MTRFDSFSRHIIEETASALRQRKRCRSDLPGDAMSLLSRYGSFTRLEIESAIRKAYKKFRESSNG